MTIETQQSKVQYQGNGTTTVFPLPFPVLRGEHVHVWVSSGGAGQKITTGFSVVGTLPTGASVQFAVAPATGERVTLARVVPYVQQMALRDGSNFSAPVVEGAFDGQEMQVQQLAEGLDRAIKLDIASDKTPEELLDSIYSAQADAKGAATAASAAQGAAENAADRSKASEELAARAKADACICADIAEAAKDVSISQAEATNTLMAAELGKIGTIIADNKRGQEAAVNAARAWAETPHGVPVGVDADGKPQYSAKHFASEAQSISIPAGTEQTAGVLRLGTEAAHKAGAQGVAAQCSEVLKMVEGILPAYTPKDKGKSLLLGAQGPEWSMVKAIPPGLIAMWCGAANAVPTGWALCNGENGTPDLRDRFVVGAGKSYAVAAASGSTFTGATTLTLSQIPSHTHPYSGSTVSSNGLWHNNEGKLAHGGGEGGNAYAIGYAGGSGSHTHSTIPPYYALACIMKLYGD